MKAIMIGHAITARSGSRPTDNFVVGKYGNNALNETIEGKELEDGDYIDAHSRRIKKDIAGTITTRVDASNGTFLVERKEQERKDEKGELELL